MGVVETHVGFIEDAEVGVSLVVGDDGRIDRIPPPPPRHLLWRAHGSGLWLEEQSLDKDLTGARAFIRLQGSIAEKGAVRIFGGETDRSNIYICAFTDQGIVHRIIVRAPRRSSHGTANREIVPAPSILSSLSRESSRHAFVRHCGDRATSPCCWISPNILTVGYMDGGVMCVKITGGLGGGQETESLSREWLRMKEGWASILPGGGAGRAVVAIEGYWQEAEQHAILISLHTDWSIRVWTVEGAGGRRGSCTSRVDCRPCLRLSQGSTVDPSSCFISSLFLSGDEDDEMDSRSFERQARTEPRVCLVIAVGATGGLPVHLTLSVAVDGTDLQPEAFLEAPGSSGPLTDVVMDNDLNVWALWGRPDSISSLARGDLSSSMNGSGSLAKYGGHALFGREGLGGGVGWGEDGQNPASVIRWVKGSEEISIDQHLQEDVKADSGLCALLAHHGGSWSALVGTHMSSTGPNNSTSIAVEGETGPGAPRATEMALEALSIIEAFHLRRVMSSGRMGRWAITQAAVEMLRRSDDATRVSGNLLSLTELEQRVLIGMREVNESLLMDIELAVAGDDVVLSPAAERAVNAIHNKWKAFVSKCTEYAWVEAAPMGLAQGHDVASGTPLVVRRGRTGLLLPTATPPLSRGGVPGALQSLVSMVEPALAAMLVSDERIDGLGDNVQGTMTHPRQSHDRPYYSALQAFDMAVELALERSAGGLQWRLRGDGETLDGRVQGMLSGMVNRILFGVGRPEEARRGGDGGFLLAQEVDRLLSVEGDVMDAVHSLVEGLDPGNLCLGWGIAQGPKPGENECVSMATSQTSDTREGELRTVSARAAGAVADLANRALRRRYEELRNTAILLQLLLHQHVQHQHQGRLETPLARELRRTSISLAIWYMNWCSIASSVGSSKLRLGTNPLQSFAQGRRRLPIEEVEMEVSEGSVVQIPQEAGLPSGCTVLQGLVLTRSKTLDGKDVGQREGTLNITALMHLCLRGIAGGASQDGVLLEFLVLTGQNSLALPLLGHAIERPTTGEGSFNIGHTGPSAFVLNSVGSCHCSAALSAATRRDSVLAGRLLDEATEWFLWADPARLGGTDRAGGDVHDDADLAEASAAHFEKALLEVERAGGGWMELNGVEGQRGYSAARALKLGERAHSVLKTARSLNQHPEKDGAFEVRESSLCERVFVHATESNEFLKAFHALCQNPNPSHRRENLSSLVRRMCDSGHLQDLCALPLERCPIGIGEQEDGGAVVESTLWKLAHRAEANTWRGESSGIKVNYYQCLHAFYVSRDDFVEAARSQVCLLRRLESDHGRSGAIAGSVVDGGGLSRAYPAQLARLAALNSLLVAQDFGKGEESLVRGEGVALFPPANGENVGYATIGGHCGVGSGGGRRISPDGLPVGLNTVETLSRDVGFARARILLAETARERRKVEVEAQAGERAIRLYPSEKLGRKAVGRRSRGGGGEFSGVGRWAVSGQPAGDGSEGPSIGEVEALRLSEGDVIESLSREGRFEEAVDLALEAWSAQPLVLQVKMDRIVQLLAQACVQGDLACDNRACLPPLVRGPHGEKPCVPGRPDALDGHSVSLWLVLQRLLYSFDGPQNNFSYHSTAAGELMKLAPSMKLPDWLEDSFIGQKQGCLGMTSWGLEGEEKPAETSRLPAPWKAFGCGVANPTILLNMYVRDGRLEDACSLLSRLLDTSAVDLELVTNQVVEDGGGLDWLPYASIDRLFALCKSSLDRARGEGSMERKSGLLERFDLVQRRLVSYFKVVKTLSDGQPANRAARGTITTFRPSGNSILDVDMSIAY
ncbi:unnamed protein product [Choristocarpus tenellus]